MPRPRSGRAPVSDLIGTNGSDTLTGSGGGEVISGLGGDDLLLAGGGADTIDGGSGIDTLSYESAIAAVTISLFPSSSGPQVSNVENLIGGAGADRLSGDPGANAISGGVGADSIDGGFGADTLDGGVGGDSLDGGDGDDLIRGGKGQDSLRGGDGVDSFRFEEQDSALALPDTILDWSADDRILTGVLGAYQEASAPDAGYAYANSLIAAGARFVAMQTPAGVMLYIDSDGRGGAAEDAVLLSGRTLADISAINVGAGETLPTAPMGPPDTGGPPTPPPPTPGPPSSATNGPDVLAGGSDRDTIHGLAGDDSITGGAGGDQLWGDDGADTLDGGVGADTLSGGFGADRYVFGVGESGSTEATVDRIDTFDLEDSLVFAGGSLIGTFVNIGAQSEGTFAAMAAAANARIASGEANFVTARLGFVTYLFVDSRNDNGQADDIVAIEAMPTGMGRIVAQPLPQAEPETPRGPGASQQSARGTVEGVMDEAHLSRLLGAEITNAASNGVSISGPRANLGMSGISLTYDSNSQLIGGAVTSVVYKELTGGATTFSINVSLAGVSAAPFGGWVQFDQTQQAFATILANDDWIHGGAGADLLRVFDGHDFLEGYGGNDTLWGGAGHDAIFATYSPIQGPPPGQASVPVGSTYLRGEDGNDSVFGGGGFDDINGNQGNDICVGGAGDDWVVGGKDNDQLFGDAGSDLVYGNLGNDTCVGGEGNDIVRGGQDNDVLWGGAGDDYVSGDKGDDTVTGGAGADSFHTFGDAGIDKVLDFNRAEGDRVQVDPGTQYAVSQVGADTVIDMVGGGKMILVGVQLSSLAPGWIFGA